MSISDDPTKSKADLSFIFDKKSPSMGSAAAAATPVPVGPSVERGSGRDTGPMKTAAVSGTGYAPAEMVSLRSAMAASDSSKTVFEHMSFEDALLYLKAREGAVDYVHCVARHHVDHKARTNTYDLVMLEKPGHPETDQVFSRDNRSDRRKQGRFPGRLMQLSLQGLIMDAQDLPAAGDKPVSVDGGSGVFVPLNVFQHERDLCFRLLDMSFFRCFKQYKAFRAWRQHSRQRVFRRRARHVESNSLFADLPLISLMFEIHRRVYELGQSIDLFEYLGSGLLNIRSYLRAQENKLYQEFAKIKASILEIGEIIEARYMHVVSTAYLGEKIDAIIVHHPYSMSKTSGAGLMLNTAAPEDVNWENVRSVQRLKAEYKGKIELVFRSAEMMIETMLGSVLLRFWSRLTRSVAGVTIVNRDAARAAIGYWAQSEEINYEKQAAIAKATSDLEGVGMDPSSPGARRKEVDDSITRKGRHLNINSAFFLDNRPFDPDSQQSTKDIAKLKISIDPSSSQVMHYLHELYGVLGVLLNNLPKLKFHPVIYKEDQTVDLFQDHESAPAAGASRAPTPAGALKKRSHWRRGESMPTPTPESEASLVTRARNETKSAASSSLLFVYIQNCTILVQMGAQQISVRALHQA